LGHPQVHNGEDHHKDGKDDKDNLDGPTGGVFGVKNGPNLEDDEDGKRS
jgi:hypothetical protein